MQNTVPFPLCSHSKADGCRSASPALRGHLLCYFHHPEARDWKQVDRSVAVHRETLRGIIRTLGEQAVDGRQKKLLLHALQLMGALDQFQIGAERTTRGLGSADSVHARVAQPPRLCLKHLGLHHHL